MLVNVIQLRFQGKKLPPEELAQARPTRGILTVVTARPTAPGDKGITYATLQNPTLSEPLLDALRGIMLPKLKGNDFILYGVQTTAPKIGSSQTFPQAWWCKLVENSSENQQTAKALETTAWAIR